MIGPCEHCPNPDKALWQTECRYKGPHWPYAFNPPPCACDQYDADRREISHGQNILAICITLCVAAVIALIFIGLKHL